MGTRDIIETPSVALDALPEPYNFASQTMLQVKLISLWSRRKFLELQIINIAT